MTRKTKFGAHCTQLVGYEGQPEKRPYNEYFQDSRLPTRHPQTWEPSSVTVRVAAQHSQFLFSPVVDDKKGSLALPTEKAGAILMIAISPALKQISSEILEQVYDIRQTTLFPDLDGFGIANGVSVGRWSSYRY